MLFTIFKEYKFSWHKSTLICFGGPKVELVAYDSTNYSPDSHDEFLSRLHITKFSSYGRVPFKIHNKNHPEFRILRIECKKKI